MSNLTPKRVLVVAYYWPPSGGGGVQRWLKMVRYLPQFGITPVVACPANADYPILDHTLLGDVPPKLETIHIPIFEPYRLLRKLTGRKSKSISAGFVSEGKKGTLIGLLGRIRGNFIIPDARKFWVRPAVRRLKAYLADHPVDVIITTGPPHSVHLIGLALRQATGTPWIADMRDFWLDMDHSDLFAMGPRAKAIHAALEKKVISGADRVICTTEGMAHHYSQFSREAAACITNGFDSADFTNRPARDSDTFIIGHYGTLGADRFTPALWEAVEELASENAEFARKLRIEMIGPTDGTTLMRIQSGPLAIRLLHVPYVPHMQAVELMCRAGLLLLAVNDNSSENARLPGKIFEYIASESPILGIGMPDSDAGRLLEQSGRGHMYHRTDKAGIKSHILHCFLNADGFEADKGFTDRFTRQMLAGNYATIIRTLSE